MKYGEEIENDVLCICCLTVSGRVRSGKKGLTFTDNGCACTPHVNPPVTDGSGAVAAA